MNISYVVDLIKLYNELKFHQISFSGLFIIMVHKILVWNLWYDPTQHPKYTFRFAANKQILVAYFCETIGSFIKYKYFPSKSRDG